MQELRKAIHKIRDGKTSGNDGIAAEIIKVLVELGCQALFNLVNHVVGGKDR